MVLDGAELSYFGQEGMQEVVVGESKVIYVLKYLLHIHSPLPVNVIIIINTHITVDPAIEAAIALRSLLFYQTFISRQFSSSSVAVNPRMGLVCRSGYENISKLWSCHGDLFETFFLISIAG